MQFKKASKHLLAVTKSKAKMYEFGIDEAHHLELAGDPSKLLVLTLSILGELSTATIKANSLEYNDDKQLTHLKYQLSICAQYFDSLHQSKLSNHNAIYLKLLGSAAYYLSDMPGSASILIRSINKKIEVPEENSLEIFLVCLLSGESYLEVDSNVGDYDHQLRSIYMSYSNFYSDEETYEQVCELCNQIREKIYFSGGDLELLLVDVIFAVILKKMQWSSIICLPKYTGIAIDQWRDVLKKTSFIKEFWPAQRLIGESGVMAGKSAVIQMPTSAGKTKSTELIIRSSFLSGRAKLAVIIAPFRSLCREISDGLTDSFKDESIIVNELLDIPFIDDSEIEFLRFFSGEEAVKNIPQFSVVVSTPEKFVYILRHQPDLANSLGLLIFDEGHQFDTGSRGVTYELLISTLKRAISPETQTVLISAVLSNAETIGEWIYGEQGSIVRGAGCLPTHCSIAFSSWKRTQGQLKYVDVNEIDNDEYYVPRVIQKINLGKQGKERSDRVFPDITGKSKANHMAAYWSVKLCCQGPVAIFCGTKASVTKICEILVDQYKRGLAIASPSEFSDKAELEKISNLASLHFKDLSPYPAAIKLGFLPHSANIPNGIRVSGEYAMQTGLARAVICTSTLAQGVNLPIKYLIVSGIHQAGEKISIRDFQNLIGRTGRSGLHTEGSVIFSSPEIYDDKKTFRGKKLWADIKNLLKFDNSEQCASSLKRLIEPFPDIPSLDVIKYITNPNKYRALVIKFALKNKLDMDKIVNQLDFRDRRL